VRLFVAVLPDDVVAAAADAALERALRRDPHGGRWRPVAAGRRHVTLRFLADADPDDTAAALRADLTGVGTTTLRTAGAGVFGTALWLGVRPDDPVAWRRLLVAVGTDPDEHVAHLTVARRRGPERGRGGERLPGVPTGLDSHRGATWTPGEVVLVASGVPYRVLERFPLVGGGAARGGETGGDEPVGPPG
jgi:2'-5' RNA ligase